MRRFAFLAASLAAVALSGATNDLAVARRALGDGLWQVAARHAGLAAADPAQRMAAQLVELEALAGAGRPAEILARLDAWKNADGDAFRYWRAWAHAEQGHFEQARAALTAPFADSAYAGLALRLSARIASATGNPDAAFRFFAQASAVLTNDAVARAENAEEWARALATVGKAAEGLDVLRTSGASAQKGASGDAARLLEADLLERKGDAQGSLQVLEKLVAGGSNTSERAFVLAACGLSERFLSAGATNLAVRVASNAVARAANPDLVCRAGYTLGFALLSSPSNRSAGVALVTDLVRKYPENPQSGDAQLRLADGLLAAGDAAGAVREYDVLLQAYPSHALDAHVLEGRGWAFLRLGRRAEAVGLFARAAQVATNAEVKARCAFKQAEALTADGRHEEAAAAFGAIDYPGLRDLARFLRADALAHAKRSAEALEIFRAIFAEGGDSAVEAELRVAALELALGHVEPAVEAYDKVLSETASRKPTPEQRVRALSGRGRARYRAYRFGDAQRDFAEVARLEPARRDEMDFLSALCLYGDGRDREAYDAGRRLLGTVADTPLRGDLQMWLAKYDAGRREWTAAIAGFEACAANRHVDDSRRVEALVRAIRCAVAMPDYRKAVELAGCVTTNAAAVAAMAKARPESALVAEALVLQGEALIELARFDEAVLVLDRAGHVPAPPAVLRRAGMARADCLFAMGADDAKRYRSALEAYRALMRDDDLPDSQRISVAFKCGRALEKLGSLEEAADQYYSKVVLFYWDAVRPDTADGTRRRWFDGNARAVFARAAFILADYYEARGELDQARKLLSYVVAARVPAADEAGRRIARLKEKGGLE